MASKYGSRQNYDAIRKARSKARKLKKAGLISDRTFEKYVETARVNRKGNVTFQSRAINNALTDYFNVLEGYEKAIRLTKQEQEALLKAYEYLPENERPIIKRGVVTIAKGQTLTRKKTKSGVDVRIGFAGETHIKNMINVGPKRSLRDIENDLRRYYERYGNKDAVAFELTQNGPGSARNFFEYHDIDSLLAYIEKYRSAGAFTGPEDIQQIRLVRLKTSKQRAEKRGDWLKEKNKDKLKKKTKKKASARSKAINKIRMRKKRSDPAYRDAERAKRREKKQ